MGLEFADLWDLFCWAILGALLAGLVCPLVGSFLLVRRTGFYGITLPQFATTGIACGYAVLPWWIAEIGLGGLDLMEALDSPHALEVYLLGWAALWTFGGLLALETFGRDRGTETGRVAASFAVATALAVIFGQLSPTGLERVEALLHGQILVIDVHQFEGLVAAFAVVLGLLYVFHRDLLLASYDPDTARVLGLSVKRRELLLSLIVGLTVASGVIVLGPMVLFGLLVLPPLAARALARSMWSFYVLGVGLGVAGAALGLVLSFNADWPLGPSLVSVGGAVWLVCAALGRWTPLGARA